MPWADPARRKRYHQEYQRRNREYFAAGNSVAYFRGKAIDGNAGRNRSAAKRRQVAKKQAIDMYGGCCSCCGEDILAFLTVDHINGYDGPRNKRPSGIKYYRWLMALGVPREGLQVLCWNCNCGRHINNGVCPHKELWPYTEE